MKYKKYLLMLIIPILVLLISRTFSLSYTEEIKSVEIQSNDYNQPGSWHIDKSAEWTGFGKAKVTFDVNTIAKTVEGTYKDVIFVIDVSGSMIGEKIEKAKSDAIELTEYLLSDSHNRVALITFSSSSEILSGFTKNKVQMTNYISNIDCGGNTNYNAGLSNVDIVMDNYDLEDNKDLVVLFLTDGYSNEGKPNQIATYQVLKDKYPFMIINGIQYEMGTEIVRSIIEISDNQYIADIDTLDNVLFDASYKPVIYDNFVITDYVNDDYFYVNSANDIVVSFGYVTLEDENGIQKITWNFGNNYKTGLSAKMNINLSLKGEFHNTSGLYPTNKSETIVSKLPDEIEKTKNSELTPVLKNSYNVIYDVNAPEGCDLLSIPTEEHFIYQSVVFKQDNLNCPGYLYKGWQIDDYDKKDIKMINDETFIMPSHNVTIRAIWTKQDLVKTMDGTIFERATLYKVLEKEAQSGTYAKEYTDAHQDSYNGNNTEKIYYWWAANNANNANVIAQKNNVIFAGICWQIIRTTDTGGVKILYNGEPEDGKCLDNRNNHVGYNNLSTQTMNGNYWYGSDYIYNKEDNTFSLNGIITQSLWNDETIPNLIGKYTCRSTSSDATCSTLYLVKEKSSSTSATVYSINSNSHYSQFGVLRYNTNSSSLSGVGFMTNNKYDFGSTIDPQAYFYIRLNLANFTDNYWYADSVQWGDPVAKKYNLINPYQIDTTNGYAETIGKYTFGNENQDYTSTAVYYICAVDETYMYVISLNSNQQLESSNTIYKTSNSFIVNDDGEYELTGEIVTTDRINWFNNYSSLGRYVCRNSEGITCTSLIQIRHKDNFMMEYRYVYKYANSFNYVCDENNNCKYVLDDTDAVYIGENNENIDEKSIRNHHYTCENVSGECDKVIYVHHRGTNTTYYLYLTGGKNISEAVNDMLYDNPNEFNSIIKTGLEAWYEHYLLDFNNFIEDTIYCASRSQTNNNLNPFNPNGGHIRQESAYSTLHFDRPLYCSKQTDKFSTFNNEAKLKYPVGLLTTREKLMPNYKTVFMTGKKYWLLSPDEFLETSIISSVDASGSVTRDPVSQSNGVRPVISLKPEVEYISGDGSKEYPYIIDTSGD